MYYFPQPPFLICLLGLFVGLTCGSAFQTILKQKVEAWSSDRNNLDLSNFNSRELKITYWGICLGVWIFLAGGLGIFNINPIIAIGLALPLTIFTTSLIWTQLGQVLMQLQSGGSEALDLDMFT